jgi:hypothetical protein
MKQLYAQLYENLNAWVDDPAQRADVLSTAVAMAASRLGGLPSEAVANPGSHYNMYVSTPIRNRAGAINEEIVFSLKDALNQARQFWMLRYYSAHPAQYQPEGTDYGFFDTLMGVPQFVDPKLHSFANEHKRALFRLANQIVSIVQSNEAATSGQDSVA